MTGIRNQVLTFHICELSALPLSLSVVSAYLLAEFLCIYQFSIVSHRE